MFGVAEVAQITPHTQPFNGLFSRTTWVSRYQKGKTNLDYTGARDSEWQWHQLGHMQVCTSLHTDNHASTPPLCFLQAGCPSCRPTNSVKALKARIMNYKQTMPHYFHHTTTTTDVLQPLSSSTCVRLSRHLQLKTGGILLVQTFTAHTPLP